MSTAIAIPPTRSSPLAAAEDVLERQRRQLVLWVPVLFGLGIALYFALPREPTVAEVAGVATLAALMPFGRRGLIWGAVVAGLTVPALGFCVAALRTQAVAHPVLERDHFGTISGRVVELSRSSSGNPRMLLDEVVLHGGPPVARVRIALTGEEALPRDVAGRRVVLTARIGPPSGPVAPGAFDFRRLAWFQRLSAVGYSDMPVLLQGERPPPSLFRLRMRLSDGIRAHLDEPVAGFAAAILTGDRSTVDQGVLADLRASNLAHLLAISGLHMGLLTAFVFMLVRRGLALLPGVALRHPVKKWGAGAALLAGFAYLALSGASVPTQRAFVMATVVLVAVMIDRPAFTLRGVALAAMIILLIRPESLLQAGFQLSFAATAALVAVFEALRGVAWWRDERRGWVTRWRGVLALAVTSAVAGAATAPFGAFHFNQVSQFGLLANLLAVPLMGMVIMPAGVAAAVLAPLGLEGVAFAVMGLGIEVVLAIADWVAGLDGSTRAVKAGPPVALVLIAVAGCWAVLWRGPGRGLAVPVFAVALVLWAMTPRPDVLASPSGRLIGAMTPEGRALNRATGSNFAALSWLEDDGRDTDREAAAARWQAVDEEGWSVVRLADGWELLLVRGRTRWPQDLPPCEGRRIYLAANWSGDAPEGFAECETMWTKDRLRATGGLAIWLTGKGIRTETVADATPRRPWTRGPAR
ncbi:ComEC/Rec2 family competence protein [Roseobacter sp. HKCCA0434]|uniref:ComEC/Rec2 family competence protein n=1 Tax=Roseobacter sp. HKCCA0434 TaxID=3079297 RepID=UPI002905B123|nr:ComEC/Rec2 family competence protein [Roseobacter sp. HKCCA0434]